MEPASASQSTQPNIAVGCRPGAEPTLGSACAVFIVAMTLGGTLLGVYEYAEHGLAGVEAAAIATVTCGLSSLAALIVAGKLRGTPYAVAGQLGGSLFRMLPPLVVVLQLQPRLPMVAAAGLFGCMVVTFLFALLVETVLLVRLVRSPSSAAGQAGLETRGPGNPLALAKTSYKVVS